MGVVSTIIGFSGFGVGSCIGVTIGYFLFVYFQSTDVKDPVVRPLAEHDSDSILKLLPEIPLWVKNPDFDRVDWLNRFVDHMWPYLDTAICKKVETIVKPLIAEKIPKYKIQSVDFETLSLGTLPPTFQGMKVFVTEEKELIMEVAMKWAGNPNILVAAKAFGMKATVQVVDLQVFAHPRITLKPLVPAFPCFANICVSLMEKPHVDFGLKLLGADAMSIPGLYRFVQELIQDRVAAMYLWPRALEVPILDSHNAMKRPVGILKVKIVRAKKLRNKELIGRSDPFVRMKLSEDLVSRKKTTVKHNNLNPEWNEEFNLTVKDPQTQALEFIVYDHEQFGNHDKMGMNVVPLSQLTPEETKSVTLDLLRSMDPNDARNGKARGHLEVELTYKPFRENEMGMDIENSDEVEKAPDGTPSGGGLLVVMIHHAEDVEGKHHTNPFARVVFKGEEKKTKHMKKNRDPRWEEEFSFMLEEPPINDKLYVEVQSVSSGIGILHPKENLGYVDISLADVVSNKRINQTFNLIESRNGKIQIELQWREAS